MSPTPAISAHPLVAVTIAQAQGVFTLVATGMGIAAALGLAWIMLPRTVLAARLGFAEKRARTAESALADVVSTIEEFTGQIRGLRSDVARLDRKLVLYAAHTTEVIMHFRRRGTLATLPQPPAEIADEIEAALRLRELAHDAATLGAAGVVTGAVAS